MSSGKTITAYDRIKEHIHYTYHDELAEFLGVSRSTFIRWLSSKNDWTIHELMKISQFLLIKGEVMNPQSIYRDIYRETETIEELMKYIPLSIKEQCDILGIDQDDYKDFQVTSIEELQLVKEMLSDTTLIPVNMKYF